MSAQFYAVAIDGPSGAGKSTVARRAAERYGFVYVDTGAIYRTVGLAAKKAGLDPTDEASVSALLPALNIRMGYSEESVQQMWLDGENVSAAIRQHDISDWASKVSALPAVRAFLMDTQRDMAKSQNVIMDGRDIGTVVLPDAGLKIFLTASAEARAQRRLLELEAKGEKYDFAAILRDVIERDERDTNRAAAPLRAAEDAVLLDTTALTLEQSVESVCALMKERFSL